MGHLQIRNVDDEVIEKLWLQANEREISIDQHIRELLQAAVTPASPPASINPDKLERFLLIGKAVTV